MGGRGRTSGDGGRERCRGGGETGKGKASKLDREPAGQTEGNESLDGPRRAVRGAGAPEGRGGRMSVRVGAVSPEGPGSQRPPADGGVGEKPRQTGGLMDGLARWGCRGWEGSWIPLIFDLRFCLKLSFLFVSLFVFVWKSAR